jgi:hypothetical protein
MIRKIPSVACLLLLLTGCSSVIFKPTQEMSIITPGADNAICYLERPGFRTRVWTPAIITITKSRGPMTIDCFASGNRERKVVVSPGGPELHDSHSGLRYTETVDDEMAALYRYPIQVAIDFTGVPPAKMPLPDYQKMFEENPDMVGMENFRPGVAALPSDRMAGGHELQLRGPGDDDSLSGESELNIISGAPGPTDTDNRMAGSAASSASSAMPSSATTAKPSSASSAKPSFKGQGKSIFDAPSSSSAPPSGFVGGTADPTALRKSP